MVFWKKIEDGKKAGSEVFFSNFLLGLEDGGRVEILWFINFIVLGKSLVFFELGIL